MLRPTPEQESFVQSLKLPLSTIFDATGMKRKQYDEYGQRYGKLLAIGVTPCRAAGHTLRSRKGNCIQCSTKTLGFLLRDTKPAWVYIAGSRNRWLLKIGSTGDLERRETELNRHRYASAGDWKMLAWAWFMQAQNIEFLIHKSLARWCNPEVYTRGGVLETTNEVFDTNYPHAHGLFLDLYREHGGQEGKQRATAKIKYAFR